MARLRSNNVFGTITNNPLLIGGTTLNAAGLANLVAVAGADRAAITLDPNRVNGAPEIVWVSAHTGAATSATILRGQEGTSARQHPSGTFWVHGWTALDAGIGTIGYAERAASQGSIGTSEVDLTGLSVAVTVGSGRRIRVTGSGYVQNTSASNQTVLKIKEDGVAANESALVHGAPNVAERTVAIAVLTPTAGAHTYKLRALATAGTSTLTAGAGYAAFILVEDIGAA